MYYPLSASSPSEEEKKKMISSLKSELLNFPNLSEKQKDKIATEIENRVKQNGKGTEVRSIYLSIYVDTNIR